MSIVLNDDYVKKFIKPRSRDCNKGDFGKVLLITSCRGMSGASVLAARAALRCGAGLCTVASAFSALLPIQLSVPEAITLPLPENLDGKISKNAIKPLIEYAKGCSAVIIGCGISVCKDTEILVPYLLNELTIPVILDADGINIVSKNITILGSTSAPLILTPHLKEMSRLTGISVCEIKSRKAQIAADFAKEHDITLVLKDFETVIATAAGKIFENHSGHPCMAKGGSGDMLSGMIGSFLAQGLSPEAAACCGVYLHAKAGSLCGERMGDHSVLASDMIEALPEVFQSI